MHRPSTPRFLLPALFLAALFFSSPQNLRAQAFSLSSSCPCTLRGTVTDSVSGQPVNRALVHLTAPASRAALTDSEGRFQFEGLPAGLVSLEADKPGYLGRDLAGNRMRPSISVRLASDSPPATLKLTPESIIYGQVSDERGEPLEGFAVNILIRAPHDGQLYPYMPGRFLTDDEGKFRIPELRPGSYYLVVRPSQGTAPNSTANSSVPLGFPPVYYPGVNDISSAVPLKLLPGKSVQANFSLKREPFVQIFGSVSGYHPRDQVNLTLQDSSGAPENSEIVFDPASGSFHTKWIPPGSYTLTAQATVVPSTETPDANIQVVRGMAAVRFRVSAAQSFARQQINTASSVSDLRLVLQPTSDIPVLVHGFPANDSPEPRVRPFPLNLIARDRGSPNPAYFAVLENAQDTPSSGDLRMVFFGVPPGAYEVMIPYGSFYAESASSGSVDLLHEDLVVDSSGAIPPINIVLRDDPATLNGTVDLGDSQLPAQVFLLTDKRRQPLPLFVGPDGTFGMAGLAPGSYRVFAVAASSNFDPQDPAFLQKISSKIQEVTLAPKQSASINLELATVED